LDLDYNVGMTIISLRSFLFRLQLLFLVFIPVQFGPHFWQNSLLYGGFRIDYLSAYIYPVDILALIISLISILLYQNKIITHAYVRLAGLFFLWSLIQLFWVKQWLPHLFWLWRLFFAVIVTIGLKLNFSQIKKAIIPIFTIQFVIFLYLSLAQIINQSSLGGAWYFLGERQFSIATPGIAKIQFLDRLWLRPYAIFSHPNTMAGYIVIITLLITTLFKEKKDQGKVKPILILSGILIFISFSQLSWATYLLVLLGYRYNQIRYIKTLFRLALLILIFSPLIMLLLPNVNMDIKMRNDIVLNSTVETPWQLLLGMGWFGSILTHKTASGVETIQPIHNALWELIVSQGILAVAIIRFIYLREIKNITFIKNSSILFILSVLFMLGSLDHYLLTQSQTCYAMLLILSLSSTKLRGQL